MTVRIMYCSLSDQSPQGKNDLQLLLNAVDNHLDRGGDVEWLQSMSTGFEGTGQSMTCKPIVILTAIMTDRRIGSMTRVPSS